MLLQPGVLKRLIRERGLTDAEVARRTGYNRVTIHKRTSGKTLRVSEVLGCRLLRVLDVQPSRLFVVPEVTNPPGQSDGSVGPSPAPPTT